MVHAIVRDRICKINIITVGWSKRFYCGDNNVHRIALYQRNGEVYQDLDILGVTADSGLTFDFVVESIPIGQFRALSHSPARLI